MAMVSDQNEKDIDPELLKLHVSMENASTAQRESAYRIGLMRIGLLEQILKNVPPELVDTSQWIAQIKKMQTQARGTSVVIGVVGKTGEGKTTFLNALLNEQALLPASCLRACTAAATEISFNENGKSKYRAEIEFIGPNDWERELTLGWEALFDENGNYVKDATSPGSEAAAFCAKIKAVYPETSIDELKQTNIHTLMAHTNASKLGKIMHFESDDPRTFSLRLKETTTGLEKGKRGCTEQSNWPLIRRVRVFVKSPILKTGIKLVDLPGTQDSNEARSKVAADYMQQCSGLMVLSRIVRAVDDRIAKDLMGSSFRRQVRMDGGFTSMTFVCTQNDYDINTEELTQFFGIEDESQGMVDAAHSEKHHNSSERKQTNESESRKAHEGENSKTAREPWANSGQNSDNDDRISAEDVGSFLKGPGQARIPAKRNSEFESNLRLHKQKPAIEDGELVGRTERQFRAAAVPSDETLYYWCRMKRDEWVINETKKDFVEEIKEFDSSNKDSESNDCLTEYRDYDKLAEELPVFCVSSKVYQKFLGNKYAAHEILGFKNKEDTGIPQVQRHCELLTRTSGENSTKYFLAMFSSLFNSLCIWMKSEIQGSVPSDKQPARVREILHSQLPSMKSKLLQQVQDTCIKIEDSIETIVYKHLDPAHRLATEKSGPTAQDWTKMAYNTIQAIARHDGIYQAKQKSYDWNENLVEPILDHLAGPWERAFCGEVYKLLDEFVSKCVIVLDDFYFSVLYELQLNHLNTYAWVEALGIQFSGSRFQLLDIKDQAQVKTSARQKEINRAFKDIIKAEMHDLYRFCEAQKGNGCREKMAGRIVRYVADHGEIFERSTKEVKRKIDNLITEMKHTLQSSIAQFHEDVSANCLMTLAGVNGDCAGIGDYGQRRTLVSEIQEFVQEIREEFQEFTFPETAQTSTSEGKDIGEKKKEEGGDVKTETKLRVLRNTDSSASVSA